ncbi:hypothetical protein DK842_22635 [Chromobacterium phragmitis]|uniref:hypothetical protein n=1 Tax=Chromobacterium phragmitis TaxID=2202141 RepID=UPI000DEC1E42|nr:hypothetical protein [Chromobacterium phragmitis]AXE32464.1 hypothetical protein DK842_22635 [Chromobacterium phragmitis]
MMDALAANPLTMPYRAEAPAGYAQARDILVKSGLRSVDMAKANLQKNLDGQPLQVRRASYIANQGRLQAGLGFTKLALLADGGAAAEISMYWKIGDRIVFQSKGAPGAQACDAVRRIWMGGIWREAWERGQGKRQANMSNLPALMFDSGSALFKSKGYGMQQAGAQVLEALNDAGQVLVAGRRGKLFHRFELSEGMAGYCLNGSMTYADTGEALPLYSAPYPGMFKP